MEPREHWIDVLPVNEHGRRALTFTVARRVVELDPVGWYVAPYCLGWTVGKEGGEAARKRYFHILKQDGEPLYFDSVEAAHSFLRLELNVLRAPIINCVPASALGE